MAEVASISIESIIKKLSSYDKKIIIALYHYKELGFNKLSRLIGAGSPSNISNRLKILISEGLVKKEKDIYKLTELGEKVAIELLIEQEIDEKKYFKKKLIPLIYSIKMNYFSFPLKIEWKYKYGIISSKIDDALKHYITLLYIKSLRNKISDSSKESIKFIKNAWKTIENPEDNYGNIPFSWSGSIKEILEEIEKDIKEKEEEKEFLILLKEKIENEDISKKIFKEFHEYSKNKILWYINKFLKLKKLAKMAIGAIIGIIPMLVLFLMNEIILNLPFLKEALKELIISLTPYENKDIMIALIIFIYHFITLPEYLIFHIIAYISIGIILGGLYAILYEKIRGKDSKIKGIAFSIGASLIIIIPYFLLSILTLINPNLNPIIRYLNIKIDIIQGLISIIINTSYILSYALFYGFILGFLWDRTIELISYLKQKYDEWKIKREYSPYLKEEVINEIIQKEKKKKKNEDLKALNNIKNIFKNKYLTIIRKYL